MATEDETMTTKLPPTTKTARTRKGSRTQRPHENALHGVLLSPLMGAACGDALGTTLEFTSPSRRGWASPVKGPHTTITGDGPFRVARGQITDDTMMAAAVAGSLTRHGVYNPFDVAAAYVAWKEVTFDIGGTTSSAMRQHRENLLRGRFNPLAAVPVAGNSSGANGGLMRATPLAVFQYRDRRAVLRHAMWDARMSHTSALCVVTNAAYCVAIARILVLRASGVTTPATLIVAAATAARWAVKEACEILRDLGTYTAKDIREAAAMVLLDMRMGEADDPLLYGEGGDSVSITGSGSGYVRTAFRLAWWQAFHASSYTEALIDTVNRGGDADTTGAIVGGLVGALFGIGGRRGIPTEWVETVMGAKTKQNTPELNEVFHPKVFGPFVESVMGAKR